MCANFRTDVLENLTRDANLLVPHLIRIRLAKVYSEKVSPQLENLSSRECMSHDSVVTYNSRFGK
jgi:hypothetical protein